MGSSSSKSPLFSPCLLACLLVCLIACAKNLLVWHTGKTSPQQSRRLRRLNFWAEGEKVKEKKLEELSTTGKERGGLPECARLPHAYGRAATFELELPKRTKKKKLPCEHIHAAPQRSADTFLRKMSILRCSDRYCAHPSNFPSRSKLQL